MLKRAHLKVYTSPEDSAFLLNWLLICFVRGDVEGADNLFKATKKTMETRVTLYLLQESNGC